jgi:heavy metal sensor kinase
VRLRFSISLRLTLWFSAIFLCGFITFGVLLMLGLTTSVTKSRDQKLKRRAEHTIEAFKRAQNNASGVSQKTKNNFIVPTQDGRVLQDYELDGKRLTPGAVAAAQFPWPAVPAGKADFSISTEFNGDLYRVYVLTTPLNGLLLRVFVARVLMDNPGLLDQPIWILIRSLPPMLLVSALAGYFISRRALMPVVRITESARSITIGNLAARLPVSPTGDELARLAETCNEMLERVEEAVKGITQFTADASHELRGPIAFIRATSDYALGAPGLDAETTLALRNIVSETDHSLGVLEDMLLLARFDAGRATLPFETVFLAEVVQGVVMRIRVLAQEKRHSLHERVSHENLLLSGDPLLLRRLIWILLDNAIKYTPHGGCIEVVLERRGRSALLIVTDNGSGIPESLLPKIFDRFFRVDPSRGEQDGTGLGLAIAKRIAETHGASIVARSERGTGATFEVAFPLSESHELQCSPAIHACFDSTANAPIVKIP